MNSIEAKAPWLGASSGLFDAPRAATTSRRFAAKLASLMLAAIVAGSAVGFADVDAVVVLAALLACAFVILDFRVGVVCLILLLPISASALFPHGIGGITGLNPFNLLVLGTLVPWLMHRRIADAAGRTAPKPVSRQLIGFYVAAFIAAGLWGAAHLGEVSSRMVNLNPMYGSTAEYLQNLVAKPLRLVVVAVLVAAAAAHSRRQELFIVPIALSAAAIAVMSIAFVLLSGIGLGELAKSESRGFYAPLGMHANDLGRLFVVAYALLLFTCAATKNAAWRFMLIGSMCVVVVALMLTFSRGSFLAFVVVNLLFLRAYPKAAPVMAAVLLVAVLPLLPAIIERVTMGWSSGDANSISAGRIEGIWLPLLSDLWRSPIFGNGLSSTIWSDAMRRGAIAFGGHPHNAYLRTLMDMGLVGLLLVGAFFFHVWKDFRRLAADPAVVPVLRGFYAGAAAGLVGFLLAGLVGSSLTPCTEQIFLWLAIGMMYGQRRITTGAAVR